ncbi:MAG: L-fuculokinase [Thermoleophilaceae bacterium]
MSDLLLGMDVGTAMCKAAVVDPGGTELAHGQVPTPWEHRPTGAETDPEALFQAAVTAARAALGRAPEGRVRGIGVTSMAETGALLDGRGRPLAPAIVWHDSRGTEEARKMADELGEEHFVEHTGLSANPLCTLVKLRWLLERRREARAAARWLSVSEWVVRRLGGRDVAELSLASRTGLLDLQGRAPFADALAWAGLPEDLLGEVVQAGTPAGTADGADLPEADGAVLTVAGHDHLCAGAGVGVIAPGDVLDSCGTAEALVRVVAPPLDGERVRRSVAGGVSVGWHLAEGRQALLGAVWSGLALQEMLDALGAERGELGARALLLPHYEAYPINMDLTSFQRTPLKLPADVAPERLWRGALEAAAAGAGAVLRHIEAVAGPRRRLVVTGGWARDEAVLASKGRLGDFEVPRVVEAGARGAALLAGVAAGLFESVDQLPPIPIPVPVGRS